MNALVSFFINSAYADTVAPAAVQAEGGGMSILIMFAIFFVFIYFGIWRPQNKRTKEHQQLMTSLNRGDEVVTSGGILGRISKVNDQHLTLTIASNVDIAIQKSSIVSVLPKGTLKTLE
jgi:preprotein translocase subunit YajC